MVPLIGPSVPRTVETIMCLTLKPAVEWALSTVHVFGPAAAGAGGWAKTGITRAAAAARVRIALRISGCSSAIRLVLALGRRRRPRRFSFRSIGVPQAARVGTPP